MSIDNKTLANLPADVKEELLAARAELEIAKAEARATKADAEATKAEAEAIMAEAEATMAEAKALKAEAEVLMLKAKSAPATTLFDEIRTLKDSIFITMKLLPMLKSRESPVMCLY